MELKPVTGFESTSMTESPVASTVEKKETEIDSVVIGPVTMDDMEAALSRFKPSSTRQEMENVSEMMAKFEQRNIEHRF